MNKKKIILILLLMFFTHRSVNAVSSCSYKEQADLNSEVAQIKVKYEEKRGPMDPSLYECGEAGEGCVAEYSFFGLTILNMSENFYIEVRGDNGVRKKFTYADVNDGIITFDHKEVDKIANYTFDVYSSTKTNCANEKYRTIHVTIPKFNTYYYDVACNENAEFYLCQKYITSEEPTFDEFIDRITDYEEQKENENEKDNRNILQKLFDFIDDHKALIGVTTTIVVAGVATVVIVKKRKETL